MGVFTFQRLLPIAPFYIWSSNHRAGNDTIFISREDPNAVFGAGQEYQCIIYGIAHSSVEISSIPYTLSYSFSYDERTINDENRDGINQLYDKCCEMESDACPNWKAAMSRDRDRWSDFCHIPGSRCDEDGNVIELNLRSFSLQCTTFPVDELGLLSKLQKLDLSNNIDLVEGQDDDMSQVAKYLNDVDSLQYIDLSN